MISALAIAALVARVPALRPLLRLALRLGPRLAALALVPLLLLWSLPVRAAVEIQEVVSPGGIEAWLVEERSIPFVALEIRFRGGASLDPEGRRGAVNLMVALLEEGAGDRDARTFQEAREALGALFRFNATDDTVAISASILTESRDEAAALLRDALVAPRFDPDAVERVRGQVLSIIAQDAQNPSALASEALSALAFPDHPYGSSLNGTVESVSALTREDLVTAHRAALVRDRVYVGAVGDIGPDELGRLLDDLLGALPAEGPSLPPRAEPAFAGGVTVVEFPSPQSVAVFGQVGIAREDPDWFAAFVLDHILGGPGFQSRLMREVRERRGLTYGIGTALVPRDLGATWLGSVASSNATVAEAIETVRAIWADVAEEGVTQAELDAAKTYLTGEYPLRFGGNAQIATMLVAIQMVGLPPSYVTERNALVEAVSLEDVRRVARRLMDPDRLTFVVVGQPQSLGSGSPVGSAPGPEGIAPPGPAGEQPVLLAPAE
ncbi:pitrilysin family protein [Rubellimicrobium sp. CFH 75288]|uniref:M16 family metallopeptidase n=1 Tax=Rubellimicrobium sp. CFH 75288 TaxID=2697034 RepID=UPI0014125F75|nr:pitrilysin family protein [Rubellimicrobium sp. CFH 75288]NAZ37236.1 insulinase family protein [Rubellimicrobium sp. CFH 75288]